MANPELLITQQSLNQGDCTLLSLEGPLTLSTMFPFRDAIQADSAPTTLVDFGKVPDVDSAGAGILVNAYVSRKRQNRKFALIGVSPRVKELLRITKIDSLFSIYDSVDAAQTELRVRDAASG
jgi:anti-sigma B factor antagonist